MQSEASAVDAYLGSLPARRREAISKVRKVVLANLPEGFEEGMIFGMLGYYVPLSRFAETHNGRPLSYVALASQERHMSLYLMGVYADPEVEAWFHERVAADGKELDMGKSCVRFRAVDDLALDVIGEAVARFSVDEFIELYERAGA